MGMHIQMVPGKLRGHLRQGLKVISTIYSRRNVLHDLSGRDCHETLMWPASLPSCTPDSGTWSAAGWAAGPQSPQGQAEKKALKSQCAQVYCTTDVSLQGGAERRQLCITWKEWEAEEGKEREKRKFIRTRGREKRGCFVWVFCFHYQRNCLK